MTSDETVYVRGQSTGGGGIVLHTDPECSHLNNANAVLEHPRDAYPDDQPVCEFCAGEYDPNSGDPSRPWETLQEMAPDDLVTDGGQDIGQSTDGTDRTGCWRCGYQRPTYEACPECGGSCKPLTKRKQQEEGDSA